MGGEAVIDLRGALRELRVSRGLSQGEAALRAGLSKAAVSAWETGSNVPRGGPLARLLDVLAPDARTRARLLHAVDPAHARIELASTPLGAPVDVGQVIRAMRVRRGTTQAELARSVRATQATVARWEAGDATPSPETIHAVGFALGASAEETTALACAQGVPSGWLPDEPFESRSEDPERGLSIPDGPLRVVVLLGLEAELWPRAARDARWDPVLGMVMGDRAIRLFLGGRLGEAEETARRALRLATTPDMHRATLQAFSALLEVATHRGADPAVLARKIEAKTARLPDGGIKGWMLWEQALRLAEMDRPNEAGELNERMVEQTALGGKHDDAWLAEARASGLLEVELRARRADRAQAALDGHQGGVRSVARVRIAHARGEAADEAMLEAMRAEPLGSYDWYGRDKIARIEREQARLARAA